MMRWIRGLGALAGLAAIIAGLPLLLIAVPTLGAPRYGWSWHGVLLALTSPDDGTLALTLIKLVGWGCWIILTGAVAVEIAARARRLPTPRLRGFRIPQLLAGRLIAAAAALFVATGTITLTATTTATPAAAAPAAAPAPEAFTPVYAGTGQRAESYVVREGDTLTGIALEQTGKASNYTRLFHASQATRQPGGRHLTDPNLILPGWTVTIPAPAHNPTHTTPPRRRPQTPVPPATGTPAPAPTPPTQTPPSPTGTAVPSNPATTAAAPTTSATAATSATSETTTDNTPVWLLSGLSGAGGLLAGSLWLAVRRRRAAQFRSRRPGRTVTAPAARLAPVEKTLKYEGSPTGELVLFIDDVLRRLATGLTAAGQTVPALHGVDVTDTQLTLRLADALNLTAPWQPIDDDHQLWRIDRAADLDSIGAFEPDSPSPWPQLVTLGWDNQGWRLVNLETLGVVSLTGDPLYADDLTRYLVTELAVSPWSRDVDIDCLATGPELPGLAPARIRHHTSPDVIPTTVAAAVATVDRLEQDTPSLTLETARATLAGDELWDSRILVTSTHDADHLPVLTKLVTDQPGRTATTVLLVNPPTPPAGVELRLSSDGHLHVPALDLNLTVNGLTQAEARGCVALLAAGADLTDATIPTDQNPHAPEWTEYCDQAGSLRNTLTVPRGSQRAGTSSLLPENDQVYVAGTANTADDLASLAPLVPVTVRDRVEAIDPTLDDDLRLWWSDSCPRPRLHVLGPVKVRVGTTGQPTKAAARVGFHTELVAYLATRPSGATTQEVADAMGVTVDRVRRDLTTTRAWLGLNPATGTPFLPEALKHPRALERGVGLYLIDGLLSDADLFRRLRLRGEARGAEGLPDLRTALRLVHGAPYDELRTRGGFWLAENRLDQHLLCGVVDVAHLVSTLALTQGDTRQARAAAELAAIAAPTEATPQLDLAAIANHDGQPAKAADIARKVVTWRDDTGEPTDLPSRAAAILRTHRWLEQAS